MTLCEGNPMVTDGFSSQMVSGAERVTMSRQHHFPPELVTDKCPTPQPAHRNPKCIAIHYRRKFSGNSRLLDHSHLGLGEKTVAVFIATQMITQRASFWEEYSKFKILFHWILSNWRQIIQLLFGDNGFTERRRQAFCNVCWLCSGSISRVRIKRVKNKQGIFLLLPWYFNDQILCKIDANLTTVLYIDGIYADSNVICVYKCLYFSLTTATVL